MSNDATINTKRLEQIASGDLFDSWLTGILNNDNTILPADAQLFDREYKVSVIIYIHEIDTPLSSDSMISCEVQEYPLWAAINEKFDWPTDKDLMTNSNLSFNIIFPEFVASVTQHLNKDNLFAYLIQVIRGVTSANQPLEAADNSEPSGHIFLKATQIFSMVNVTLHNQDVHIKLVGRGERIIEDLYINVYRKHANHTDWLRSVSNHINKSMNFVRIVSPQDAVTAGVIASATSEHDIWVSNFAGAYTGVTVSLIARWRPLSINIKVSASLTERQVISLRIRTTTGRVNQHQIVVPQNYHDAGNLQFYLASFINHRIDGLAYGVLQDDGTISAQRSVPDYRIYAWHESEIEHVELSIVDKPPTLWLDIPMPHMRRTAIAPDSGPVPDVNQTAELSIWDALGRLDGKRLDAQSYLEQLIRRCLEASGLDASQRSNIRLSDTLIFKYLQGNTGFVHAAGAASASLKRYKIFSVLQIALGEAERQRSIWEREIDVYSKNAQFTPAMITAIKSIRDKLPEEFANDLTELSSKTEFIVMFESACRSISKARTALYLDAQSATNEFSHLAANYLSAKLVPRLVKLNQDFVPSLIALTASATSALLVSVNPTQSDTFTVLGWQALEQTDEDLERLRKFIEPHLPLAKQLQLTIEDLRTLHGRTVSVAVPVVVPRLTFHPVANWETSLRLQSIEHAKSDLNFLVYTSREQYLRCRLRLRQTALRAVSAMASILLPASLGVSAIVASGLAQATINSIGIWTNVQLADNTDRGTDYQHYINEGKLGALLLAVEWAGDIISMKITIGRLIRQITSLTRLIPAAISGTSSTPTPPAHLVSAEYFHPTSDYFKPFVSDLVACLLRSDHAQSVAHWIKWPQGNAYDASAKVKAAMAAGGWSTDIIGVLMLDHPSSELPVHHFALLGKKSSAQMVVDLTIGQYGAASNRSAYIGTLADWESYFANLNSNKGRIILYKTYNSATAASHEMGAWRPGGAMGNSRFINSADYDVAHCPSQFSGTLDNQLNRAWQGINTTTAWTSASTLTKPLFKQISHLTALRSNVEIELRRCLGLNRVVDLRTALLNLHCSTTDAPAQVRAKIETAVEAQWKEIDRISRHLESLSLSQPDQIEISQSQAVATAVAWLVMTSLATRKNYTIVARVVQSYVTGSLKNHRFHDRSAISVLHRELQVEPEDLPLATLATPNVLSDISKAALQDRYLARLDSIAATERGERLFAIVASCQPYQNGNELLARSLYAIETLRLQRFVKLTVAQERELAGVMTTT